MAFRKTSYTELLGSAALDREVDPHEIITLLKKAQDIPNQLLPFKGIIHLIDYTQRRHLAISGPLTNLTGYQASDIIDEGLGFMLDIFHKDDFAIYNGQVFTQVTELLCKTPHEQHDQLIFSFSYRLRKADQSYMTVYQQGTYITDPQTHLPLYSIAVVNDITPLKRDNSMLFTVDKRPDAGQSVGHLNLLEQYFHPGTAETKFSKRETELLKLLSEGFSSKQIAHRLFISESTVINHRKNMLYKSSSKNSAELIRYALQRGLI